MGRLDLLVKRNGREVRLLEVHRRDLGDATDVEPARRVQAPATVPGEDGSGSGPDQGHQPDLHDHGGVPEGRLRGHGDQDGDDGAHEDHPSLAAAEGDEQTDGDADGAEDHERGPDGIRLDARDREDDQTDQGGDDGDERHDASHDSEAGDEARRCALHA